MRLAGEPVPPLCISAFWAPPWDRGSLSSTTNASTAWGTNNRALFIPYYLSEPVIATVLWWQNGASVSGTVDCGIYDHEGNRLVSARADAGSDITQTGVDGSGLQSRNITDTPIPAGLIYLALSSSSSTATFWKTAAGTGSGGLGVSAYLQESAHPLPATATFARADVAGLITKYGFLRAPRTVT